MKWIKRIFFFLLIVGLYFLPSLIFRTDNEFYNSLNGPKIPEIVFPIVWTIIYILLGIHIVYNFENRKKYNKNDFKRWFIFLVINYIISASFPYFFFIRENLFFGYIITLFSFLTITLVAIESLLLNKKTTLLLLPYIIWGLIASIFSILLYFNN